MECLGSFPPNHSCELGGLHEILKPSLEHRYPHDFQRSSPDLLGGEGGAPTNRTNGIGSSRVFAKVFSARAFRRWNIWTAFLGISCLMLLVGHSCRTLLWNTLAAHSSPTLLWNAIVGHSCVIRYLWIFKAQLVMQDDAGLVLKQFLARAGGMDHLGNSGVL